MKSKVKIKKDKKLDRTVIDFFKLNNKNKEDFRFNILDTLIKGQQLFVMINTNLCCSIDNSVPMNNIKIIEKYIVDRGYDNIIIPIENTNRKSVFGIRLGDNKNSSYKLGFIVPSDNFNRDLFDKLFNIYDVEIGIGLVKSKEETLEDFRKGYLDKLFNNEYLENSIFMGIMFDKIITDMEINEDEIKGLGKM
jgi:hypothetical protein